MKCRWIMLPGLSGLLLALGGCVDGPGAPTLKVAQTPPSGPPSAYYIGRRYYNQHFGFWGYVRRPEEPWREAVLVIFNEKGTIAPDRAANRIGADDNCEYRLYGRYTGDTVYEPASNRLYPEFRLAGYQLREQNPAPIFAPRPQPSDTVIRQPQ